ncbi:MAG TPA: hypothetical protein VMC84_08660 [Methanocella sp.]|uniref:hypothetical protein n=1 Tax=Methanocella sp. TaxID=2052833 RepID=UPI002CF2F177|nr:hypothetical protein [Methanocella sp.]HTY91232.1 hypothetical protein [Methanocella sp.]
MLALFGLFIVAASAASAQVTPLAVGAGNLGNGITNTWYTTSGVGGAATTDSFVNDYVGQTAVQGCGGPFGWGGWGGWGGCGISPFASYGPFSTGVGGNWGAQNSAATGSAGASSFGLQPIGVVFGVPVAGPGGYLYT